MKQLSKFQVATAIAIFFHLVGLVGILFLDKEFFISATPLNLLLSFALLVWTQQGKNSYFFAFLALVFCIGFAVEAIGVNTGQLFGDYSYGTVLGPKWQHAPLVIGINWIIVICCCGITTHTMITQAAANLPTGTGGKISGLRALSVIVDGATLAVIFDWLMEPVAVKLGFWTWHSGAGIPTYNYFCWFIISAVLLTLFHFARFSKPNKFAINLLLIQSMFFLILRTFLP
ncbi:MAG: carotenoid biosynthesis protein [Ferruginibacter sp.]|nr:carotenoid biosynthesis protein [Ferruginibacter sp.]